MLASLKELPPPLNPDRIGYPWTEISPTPFVTGSYPRLSIVTPSYNQGRFIEETIRSVLAQGYPNLEYIVIDGGSQDETVSILEHYSPWLSYWVSEKDQGQTHAINKGFARSTGDIMGWLNSDDFLLPDALAQIHTAFKDPQTKVVQGFRRIYDAQSRFLRNYFYWKPNAEFVRYGCVVAQETVYWRRDVWDTLGALDESFRFAMDYEYWQRMIAAGYEMRLLPHYIGGFREHEAAKTSAQTDIRAQDLAVIYQRYGIAQDEAHTFRLLDERLGKAWRTKNRFFRDVALKPISDNPRHLLRLFDLMHLPLISDLLVFLYRRYARLRGRNVYE